MLARGALRLERRDRAWLERARNPHRGLGQSPFSVFLRVLTFSGASKAALEHATHWRCPVCLEASRAIHVEMLGEESCLACLVWTREASLTQLLVRDAKDFGWTFESLGATRDGMAWSKDMVGSLGEIWNTHMCAHQGTTAGQEATLTGCGVAPHKRRRLERLLGRRVVGLQTLRKSEAPALHKFVTRVWLSDSKLRGW